MARIIYPENFHDQRKLLADILAKHTADGAASVLTVYLTEQDIVLADDVTDGNTALGHENNRALQSRLAETLNQLRDQTFDAPFSVLQKSFQFLKGLYKPAVSKVGEWGATVNGNAIVYPPEFIERHNLFKTFKQKYDSYVPPAPTPLDPLFNEHNIVMANLGLLNDQAKTHHDNFITATNASENFRQQRDLLWNPVIEDYKGIGDYLKKLFVLNPKKLGDWGFTVDDSPRAPKERTSKVKLLSQITTSGIVIGSTFKNIGTVPLHVYKGKTTTGTPAIVGSGESLGMAKGYSRITVVNPSNTTTGVFKVLIIN